MINSTHCLTASLSQQAASNETIAVAAITTAIATFLLVLVPLAIGVWRGALKLRDGLRDNTNAVESLASRIDGTATAFGLERRVTDLEHWRIVQETKQTVIAEGKSGP